MFAEHAGFVVWTAFSQYVQHLSCGSSIAGFIKMTWLHSIKNIYRACRVRGVDSFLSVCAASQLWLLPSQCPTCMSVGCLFCCLSCRVWDVDTCKEVQQLTFESAPSSLNLSANGNIMIITYGQNVAFYNVDT